MKDKANAYPRGNHAKHKGKHYEQFNCTIYTRGIFKTWR